MSDDAPAFRVFQTLGHVPFSEARRAPLMKLKFTDEKQPDGVTLMSGKNVGKTDMENTKNAQAEQKTPSIPNATLVDKIAGIGQAPTRASELYPGEREVKAGPGKVSPGETAVSTAKQVKRSTSDYGGKYGPDKNLAELTYMTPKPIPSIDAIEKEHALRALDKAAEKMDRESVVAAMEALGKLSSPTPTNFSFSSGFDQLRDVLAANSVKELAEAEDRKFLEIMRGTRGLDSGVGTLPTVAYGVNPYQDDVTRSAGGYSQSKNMYPRAIPFDAGFIDRMEEVTRQIGQLEAKHKQQSIRVSEQPMFLGVVEHEMRPLEKGDAVALAISYTGVQYARRAHLPNEEALVKGIVLRGHVQNGLPVEVLFENGDVKELLTLEEDDLYWMTLDALRMKS